MLDVKNFSLDPHAAIPITASLATDYDEQVSLHGHMGLTPFFVDIEIQANHLPLSVYQPYYQEQVAIKPGGQLDLQARVSISPEAPLEILDGRVDLHALDLPFTPKEGFRMNRMAITGLSYSLAENLLNLESLQLDRGDLRFSRNARGEWSFVSPDYPVFAGLAETDHAPAAAPAEEPADGTPFSYRVGEITVSDWSVDFLDRQPAKKARLQLSGIQSSVKNLAAPEKVASPFDLKATLNRTGQIHLSGDAIIASQEFNINSRLRNLPLNALAPYIAEQANLVLADGNLDARFNTRAAIKPAGLQVKFGGNIGVDKIYCLDAAHQEDLLKWDSLQIAGIKGSWAPLNLSVDSITMSDYFAKVLIDENAQLNFAQVFQKETSPQTGETDSNGAESPPPTKPAEVASGSEDAMNIRIDRVTLQGGQVDFTDRNLPRPFHVDMRELGGSIRGLSSDINTRANVDLRGKLRNQSPLVIEGALNPLAEEMFLDLKLNFSDIEMSPMSPYSGTYLGYLIENGKLHLALEYLVEEGKLQASNEVFLDQFTFGDTVESEQATSLPVKLAIALLKDRNGEIHLDIPVSGVLDDPQFSIAGVVWTIIKNLLVKAATSPLALLGALVGGGDEDFSSIDFTYGSANLTEAERGKLANMAQALLDRPSLNLEVQGFVDPENDPEGYRREQLRMKIEHARQLDLIKQRKGQEDTAVAPLEIPSEEYSDYLWSVYKQAEFPKPRNFIGMVKHLPDAELEKLIYTNTVVGPDELAELAQARAQTARDYLVNEAGVAAEQVFLSAPDINKLPAKEEASRSRVEFGITVK